MDNSVVAKAHALLKVHKPNQKWRFIVFTVGCSTHNIGKYISNIFELVHKQTNAFAEHSWDLKDKLKNVKVPNTHYVVSFGVVSMIDGISIDLAMDCIEETLNLNKNLTKIIKNEIATITVLDNTVSFFNNKFYKQSSGCSVASNLLMEYIQNRALNNLSFTLIIRNGRWYICYCLFW